MINIIIFIGTQGIYYKWKDKWNSYNSNDFFLEHEIWLAKYDSILNN